MEWVALVVVAALLGSCVAVIEVARTLRAHHFNTPYPWLARCALTWLVVLDSPATTLRNLFLLAWIGLVHVFLVSVPLYFAMKLGMPIEEASLGPVLGLVLVFAAKGGRFCLAPAPRALVSPGWPGRLGDASSASVIGRLRSSTRRAWCAALGLDRLTSHRHITRTALLVDMERRLALTPGREQTALRFLNSDDFASRYSSQVAFVDQTDPKSVMTAILACFQYDLAAALGYLAVWGYEGREMRHMLLRMRVNRTMRVRVEGGESWADHRVLDESPRGMCFQEWVLFLDDGTRVEVSDGTDVAAGRVAHTFEREDGRRFFGVAFDHPLPRSMLRFGTARFWSHHHPELA